MNAQQSFLMAGVISGMFSIMLGFLLVFTASNRPVTKKRFMAGLITGGFIVGAIQCFISIIIKP